MGIEPVKGCWENDFAIHDSAILSIHLAAVHRDSP
jgi:hypothetical protein